MEAKPDTPDAEIPILFVEDDDFFREITTQNLRDSGFQVIGFDRGVNALKYFREGGTAQLALLDTAHMSPVERAEEFADLVRRFIASV